MRSPVATASSAIASSIRRISTRRAPRGDVVRDWLDGTEMLLKGGQVGDADLFEVVRTLGE